ncbi:hypothetical protein ACFVTC_01890 [Streptomyces sp. NPDC057950]|uniref:hypothetical protein n=1 Tax=Streptomyces sp. NPDC057950 TaxID=3346288 RepID=UPI0036ECEBEE
MTDDFSGPTRRPTRRSYAELEAEHFVRELEDGGAYVSPGHASTWRGLEGHDPLDDESPDEFTLRYWEEWHDASENEEERPERRRPSGRGVDIVPPSVGEVAIRVDPEVARRFAEKHAAQRAEATSTLTYESAGGVVTVEGLTKAWSGPCAQCSEPFVQRRPASQRRKWRTLCSDVCSAGWKRDRARERKQRQRSAEAA